MAHIPFGYRIERGRAEIIPGEAEQIRLFMESYVNGLSVRAAGDKAGIDLDTSTLSSLLRNCLYLGTDYYPALIDRELYDRVQAAREKRTHPGLVRSSPICPVKTRFRLVLPEAAPATAGETVSCLYSLVTPAADGKGRLSKIEVTQITDWYRQTANHDKGEKTV